MLKTYNIIIFLILIIFLLTLNINLTKKVNGQRFHNYTIFIDPGHGGYDGGATCNGIKEKDLNLQVALILRNYLEGLGIRVLMTRASDIDYASNSRGSKKRTDLLHRIDMINNSDADLFISIHMNKMVNTSYYGAQTFYYPKNADNKLLAESIQANLKETLNTKREAKSINSLFLFRKVNKPGVLVEAGFISNFEEAKLLKQPTYQDKVAYTIYIGIIQYLTAKDNM